MLVIQTLHKFVAVGVYVKGDPESTARDLQLLDFKSHTRLTAHEHAPHIATRLPAP